MKNARTVVPPCPICSGLDAVFVSHHADFINTGIWFCSHCNHWFGYPEPNRLDLDRYYKETYSPNRRMYFSEEYYVMMERRAKAQIQFIEECLSRSGVPGNLRGWKALDWGCGIGALVAELQNRGFDAVGCDSDMEAIEVGQKQCAANITLNSSCDLSVHRGQFDLLLMSHVVEHLPSVRRTLQDLIKVLQPARYIFIEVPNCFGEMFLTETDPEFHLNFFSKQSLTLLLEGLGIQVLTCVSCGPHKEAALRRKKISLLQNLSTRIAHGVKFIPNLIARSSSVNAKQIRTIYDGFYEHYLPDENGLWLRCLARI